MKSINLLEHSDDDQMQSTLTKNQVIMMEDPAEDDIKTGYTNRERKLKKKTSI